MSSGPAVIWHLSRRFFGSLSPLPPSAEDEEWVDSVLTDGERSLWLAMSNPDRRHAIDVARAVDSQLTPELLGDRDRTEVLAAALLHDSGKVVSDMGTMARVGATVVSVGLPASWFERWVVKDNSWRKRVADYRRHPELGALELANRGARPLVYTWAAEHHREPATWLTPAPVGLLLKRCDDD